ncbi:MAG: transcriptional regulator GcvA [Pseudomonadota bacterium]
MNNGSFRQLPPTSALRALEAASRHLSFTKAAAELNITQSAISHQIGGLEKSWGLALFERNGRDLRLTPAGRDIANIAARLLADLTDALSRHRHGPHRKALRISTVQSFAVKWLVPRLYSFQAQYPHLDVWVSSNEDFVDFAPGPGGDQVDAAIRLCQRRFPELNMTPLLREDVFPVCSPAFIERWGRPEKPEDLRGLPLLLRHQDRGVPTWKDWFAAVGIADLPLSEGIRYSESSMTIQVALEGQGIALARSAHLLDELERGNLIRLFDIPIPSPLRYHFVCHHLRAEETEIRAFRDWIIVEAEKSQTSFGIPL